jgi:hypothetical protein
MQYLVNMTAPWDGKSYGTPWQIFFAVQPWRTGDTWEVLLAASPFYPLDRDPYALSPRILQNAALPRTFGATRPKEIKRMLKFGRDSNWPLYITVASTLDGTNSISITYEASWEDCDGETNWFWNQFVDLSVSYGLIGLPVAARPNH